MKRKGIVLALAALAAGGVQAQDSGRSGDSELTLAEVDALTHRLDMMPEIYGQLGLVMEHRDTDDTPVSRSRGTVGSETAFRDSNSWIGLRNRTELMPGTEGFFRAEWRSIPTRADEDRNRMFDEHVEYAYIGLEGDFGRIWGGVDDTVYEQQLDHVANFFEGEFRHEDGGRDTRRHPLGPYTTGRDRLVQYTTPSWGDLRLHAAVQLNEDGSPEVGNDQEKESRPYQAVLSYTPGNWEWALGMDSNDGGDVLGANPSERERLQAGNENTYGGRMTYEGERWHFTAQYQHRKDIASVAALLTSYRIGPNRFSVSWERERDELAQQVSGGDLDSETTNAYTAQVMHDLTESMAVYVEGYKASSNEQTPDRFDLMVGARYRF
ncbi:porin [uncultured Halovibrio sp.]|uniref:porin n=1 Tax=uncultured Halovibrio sp. TaxID=985049 RepID=UPI0025ED8492|nr:porin [uncultured Halovibrio sp.]